MNSPKAQPTRQERRALERQQSKLGKTPDTTITTASAEQQRGGITSSTRNKVLLGLAAALVAGVGVYEAMDKGDSPTVPVASPASAPVPERKQVMSQLEMGGRAFFKAAFDEVMAGVPDIDKEKEARGEPQEISFLTELKYFEQHLVSWGSLQPDGRIVAAEGGNRSGAWVIVVPPGSSSFVRNGHTFKVMDRPDLNLLQIQPVRMSSPWAGFIFTHELKHLHDKVSGAEPKHASREQYLKGEVGAYIIEIELIDHYTNGRFSKMIKQLAQEQGLNSVEEILKYILLRDYNHRYKILLRTVCDQLITEKGAQSGEERSARDGLYATALAFHLINSQNPDKDVAFKAMQDFIGKIYAARGPEYLPAE